MVEPKPRPRASAFVPLRQDPARVAWRRASRWIAILVLLAALLATMISRPKPVLLWNVSPSSKIGLYGVGRARGAEAGMTVVAWPPAEARHLAAARNYLPASVPLVKTVAAVEGDVVCGDGRRILVNGRVAAVRRRLDGQRRPLPWWTGCHVLRAGDLFLLSERADAFDGRYFGLTRPDQMIGTARLLWAF